jgi:hypothetical protein
MVEVRTPALSREVEEVSRFWNGVLQSRDLNPVSDGLLAT